MVVHEPIHCVLHDSPRAFLQEAEAHLLARESENSLILGLISGIAAGTRRCESPIIASLSRGDERLGAGLRTAPSIPLLLTRMPDAAVDCLVDTLDEAGVELTGVRGARDASVRFADGWSRRRGLEVTVGMRTCLYELRTVQMPDLDGGALRQAVESEEAAIVAFSRAFVRETDPDDDDPDGRARDIAGRLLPAGRVYLWRDRAGHTVSMAAQVRASPNGASISLVYTPPEHRGHGYASRVVACLSQRLLDEGRTLCNLYTDLANPTSNAIYQRIGYQRVTESWLHRFTPGPPQFSL
jgi:GNAT superfamily N-acetyltransferase